MLHGLRVTYSSSNSSNIPSWLVSADPPRRADLIFVLAGLQSRKSFALELLQNGMAPRILLSVGRYEIRRFSNLPLPSPLDLLQVAQDVAPPRRHYFVYFADEKVEVQLIPARGFGTLREMEALRKWLEAHASIKSLMVVSSGSHLRRLRMSCRALLPRNVEFHLVAAPEETSSPEVRMWFLDRRTRSTVLRELAKIVAYSLMLPLRRIATLGRNKPDKPGTD